ncbi:MAG TPA: hypothetical protein VHR66_18390 [Gemmataceae bacterium]|jgi:hypothetical protein|nr:hypothetical protein [Gemmataceae bacterium]
MLRQFDPPSPEEEHGGFVGQPIVFAKVLVDILDQIFCEGQKEAGDFVLVAEADGPVEIVGIGPTRGDDRTLGQHLSQTLLELSQKPGIVAELASQKDFEVTVSHACKPGAREFDLPEQRVAVSRNGKPAAYQTAFALGLG